MSGGAFAEWQPRYAEVGIATFPVRGKVPAVKGYLDLKLGGSRKLIERFPDAGAFGIALKPSNITVVDVDTPDERVLADALARHGDTPFIVRSGSGHLQEERRRIRPDPTVRIDILGEGFVVAPPSSTHRGCYELIQGSLADLPSLPTLQNPLPARAPARASEGRRNDTLWRHCMQQARYCDDFAALLDVARTANAGYLPPLEEAEIIKTAASAWGYTERGENWFGRGKRVFSTHDEVDQLLHQHPDAYILLTILRRHHWGRDFVVANAMASAMPGGWTEKRLSRARRDLESAGKLQLIRSAGQYRGPALYRLN